MTANSISAFSPHAAFFSSPLNARTGCSSFLLPFPPHLLFSLPWIPAPATTPFSPLPWGERGDAHASGEGERKPPSGGFRCGWGVGVRYTAPHLEGHPELVSGSHYSIYPPVFVCKMHEMLKRVQHDNLILVRHDSLVCRGTVWWGRLKKTPLRAFMAESTGLEPVHRYSRWRISNPLHYHSANSPSTWLPAIFIVCFLCSQSFFAKKIFL